MIWHNSDVSDVLSELSVNPEKGLLSGIADERLSIYGKNSSNEQEKPSYLKCFINALNNKWVYILLAISVLSFIVSFVYNKSEISYLLLIIAIIVINALITAYYRFKSDIAIQKLNSLTCPQATVIRDGLQKQISSDLLVPGDILVLNQGDYITADARLIECNGLRCDENALCSDNIPKEKHANEVFEDITVIAARNNMVFAGTSVVSGNGKAVVVETANNTEIGKTDKIAKQIKSDELPIKSSLDTIGNIINIAVIILCLIAFVIGILKNIHTTEPFATMTLSMLVNVLALGVAAIPESLPAISVIVVALGIEQIISENIIIKRTKALEVLGKTSVICADKTGILTKATMHLECIYDGTKLTYLNGDKLDDKNAMALRLSALCSTLINDTTEAAIERAAVEYNNESKEHVENIFPRVAVIPFDTARKSMCSINMINGAPVAIVKGAAENLIEKCVDIDTKTVQKQSEEFAKEGMRVICVALKTLTEIPANPTAEEIENDLTFVALLGLNDPPRSGAVEGIKICDKAGIKTIMITGDNPQTAFSVANQIGIITDESQLITGEELDKLSDEELLKDIKKYTVYARITPSDKLRIIDAWQKCGEVVTVTGDNIEDANALNNANIGCAMGKHGTDVARGNADIVIEDNNFITLVNAIKASRGLFDNIKKSITYLLGCNLSEILIFIIGLAIYGLPPLTAVQLLWINLLTDCAPSISLATEKAEQNVMNKKPITINGRLFDFNTAVSIATSGFFLTFIAIIAFVIGTSTSIACAMTMCFLTVSLSQIFHAYNVRSDLSIAKSNLKSNPFMNYSTLILIFISMFLCLTPAGSLFGLTVLNAKNFFISLGLSILIVPFAELMKFLFKKFEV